jgi:hypothetical protein
MNLGAAWAALRAAPAPAGDSAKAPIATAKAPTQSRRSTFVQCDIYRPFAVMTEPLTSEATGCRCRIRSTGTQNPSTRFSAAAAPDWEG